MYLHYNVTLCKPTLFNTNQIIYAQMYLTYMESFYGKQYICTIYLDVYVDVTYCTSYLTKVDKSIACEMQYILDKCNFEET
jgi:hypothetical protein